MGRAAAVGVAIGDKEDHLLLVGVGGCVVFGPFGGALECDQGRRAAAGAVGVEGVDELCFLLVGRRACGGQFAEGDERGGALVDAAAVAAVAAG